MKFWQTVKSFVLQYKVLLALYVLITLFTYFQLTSFGHNNNFIIYRESVFHFLKGLPLYIEYPEQYFDLFLLQSCFPGIVHALCYAACKWWYTSMDTLYIAKLLSDIQVHAFGE